MYRASVLPALLVHIISCQILFCIRSRPGVTLEGFVTVLSPCELTANSIGPGSYCGSSASSGRESRLCVELRCLPSKSSKIIRVELWDEDPITTHLLIADTIDAASFVSSLIEHWGNISSSQMIDKIFVGQSLMAWAQLEFVISSKLARTEKAKWLSPRGQTEFTGVNCGSLSSAIAYVCPEYALQNVGQSFPVGQPS